MGPVIQSKPFRGTRRFLVLASLAANLLMVSSPVRAGSELERIFESAIGRFLMTETAAGQSLVRGSLGRVLPAGESLDPLAIRLRDLELKPLVDRLEIRLQRIEGEFKKDFPASGAELSAEQRALLRALVQNELYIAPQFLPKAVASAEINRQTFLRATRSAAGLRPTLRFPYGVAPESHPTWLLQFGFESEYTLKDLDKLLTVYGPAPQFGISAKTWLQTPIADRVSWVKKNVNELFPTLRETGSLIRVNADPRLDFLPKNLIRDSTGNLEIILGPVNSFEEWQRNVFLLNEKLGVGSMQGTVSLPIDAFFGGASNGLATRQNLGFFNFNNEFDSLQKLELGAARFAQDPTRPAANSFIHSFLGPMTRLKQLRLIKYLTANARGEMLDAVSLKAVSAEDHSFKYVGGTAYRPDIARNRIILEVRDAHTSLDALLDRTARALVYLEHGRASFEGAAELTAFDSKVDFEKLPDNVQAALKKLFPAKLLPGTDYSSEERMALEVFRNFGYPMRDWERQLQFIGASTARNQVRLAQRAYSSKLQAIATDLENLVITSEQASLRIQGALAQFASESGLAKLYRKWSNTMLLMTIPQTAHQKAG